MRGGTRIRGCGPVRKLRVACCMLKSMTVSMHASLLELNLLHSCTVPLAWNGKEKASQKVREKLIWIITISKFKKLHHALQIAMTLRPQTYLHKSKSPLKWTLNFIEIVH